jgi:hypothetical protein
MEFGDVATWVGVVLGAIGTGFGGYNWWEARRVPRPTIEIDYNLMTLPNNAHTSRAFGALIIIRNNDTKNSTILSRIEIGEKIALHQMKVSASQLPSRTRLIESRKPVLEGGRVLDGDWWIPPQPGDGALDIMMGIQLTGLAEAFDKPTIMALTFRRRGPVGYAGTVIDRRQLNVVLPGPQ